MVSASSRLLLWLLFGLRGKCTERKRGWREPGTGLGPNEGSLNAQAGPQGPSLALGGPSRPAARGWLPSSPTPREAPASPGFVVSRGWSLSRSKPLAELFDAKNRLFHQKAQRKIHFMSQKELQLGVFFLPLGALGL